jgi:16S rRNA (guanine527-N7)-methyltransferase
VTVIRDRISGGAKQLSCSLNNHQLDTLTTFLSLLQRWNRVYNLTAVRDLVDMVPRHVLDSMAVARHLRPHRVLDVGSGAGLPGVPLAVVCPDLEFILLDSNAKRTRFLTQVKAELALDNVEVVSARVERYNRGVKYDTVISRAFAAPAAFVQLAGHLTATDGILLSMQGREDGLTDKTLPAGYRLDQMFRIAVPGSTAQRHLLQIVRDQPNCRGMHG